MISEYEEYQQTYTDKSIHTVRAYEKAIGDFLLHFGIQSIGDLISLRPADYRNYQNYLQKYGLSPSSVNSRIRPIKAFLNWLCDNDYIDMVPRIKNIRGIEKEQVYLSREECVQLVDGCKNEQSKVMIAFMIVTGMRRDEVSNAKVGDVNDGIILVNGKGKKQRKLPIDKTVLQMLRLYLGNRTDGFLFPNTRGGQLSGESIRQRLNTAMKQAGFSKKRIGEITPHKLRATAATNWLENTDLRTVQEALGHSSVVTTQRYAQVRSLSVLAEQNLFGGE